jgi:hypothetical protein
MAGVDGISVSAFQTAALIGAVVIAADATCLVALDARWLATNPTQHRDWLDLHL